MEKNRSGSEGSWSVKLVPPSPTSILHYECYNTSTPNTPQHPVSLSKTPQSTPSVTPSIDTTIKPTSSPAMTPEDALSDMGYPKDKVLEMGETSKEEQGYKRTVMPYCYKTVRERASHVGFHRKIYRSIKTTLSELEERVW